MINDIIIQSRAMVRLFYAYYYGYDINGGCQQHYITQPYMRLYACSGHHASAQPCQPATASIRQPLSYSNTIKPGTAAIITAIYQPYPYPLPLSIFPHLPFTFHLTPPSNNDKSPFTGAFAKNLYLLIMPC